MKYIKFYFWIIFLVLVACQKEGIEFSQNEKEISLTEAKLFFENSKKGETFLIEPQWQTFEQRGRNEVGNFCAFADVVINNKKTAQILFTRKGTLLESRILFSFKEDNRIKLLVITDCNGKFQEGYYTHDNELIAVVPNYSSPKIRAWHFEKKSNFMNLVHKYGEEDGGGFCLFCVDYALTEVVVEAPSRKRFPRTHTPSTPKPIFSPNFGEEPNLWREYGHTNQYIFPDVGGGNTLPTTKQPTKIIENISNQKIKCIHNKLRNGNNDYVKQILDKFEGDGSEFNIIIESQPSVITPKGEEKDSKGICWLEGKTIHIRISSNYAAGASALEVAKTIFHEYIHADIYRKLNTQREGKLPEIKSFRETYSAYINMIIEKKGNISDPQKHHEYMAKHYVSVLSSALKQFHREFFPEDIIKYEQWYEEPISDKIYEAIAWIGLKEHGVEAYYTDDYQKKYIDSLTVKSSSLTKTCK